MNLDGGDFHAAPFNANMPVPFLMLYSDYDALARQLRDDDDGDTFGFNDFSYERHETAGLREDVLRFKVADVAHLGYSDFNWFMRNPVRSLLLGSIDGGTMLALQNDFVRGFFDRYLRGAANDFPEGTVARYGVHVAPDAVSNMRRWWLAEHPEDRTERVVMETTEGLLELAIYPERAPVSAANFLAYVREGLYDGATLYRAARANQGSGIAVVQGGRLGDALQGDGAAYLAPRFPLPPIAHETTQRTGIPNERGTIAYARLAPGTAGSEFFFNMADNPQLDTGANAPERDGYGYATFGRVLRGLRVLDAVHGLPTDAEAGVAAVRGQLLSNPVGITRAYVVEPDAS